MKWLVLALLVLLASMIFNMGLLTYALYVLIGVILGSRLLAEGWIKNVDATRQCNRLTAEVGDTVAVIVDVANSGRFPVPWVLMDDVLPRRALIHDPPALAVTGSRLQLAMLRRGGKKSLLYQLRCNRRGYYQIGPLVLETGDLFGLYRKFRVATDPNFLLVYPKVVPIIGFDIASKRPIGEVRMSYRLYEDPTRIAGVRQYQPGDPLNRIHWRATARTGALHSKVYEPSTVTGVTLVLDFHQDSHDAANEPVRSELAVTAAASIANAIFEMGQQIGLVTNGRDAADRIRQEGWQVHLPNRKAAVRSAAMLDTSDRLQPLIVPTRRGPEQFRGILESLARVELTDGLRLPELLIESAPRMPRDATVMVILRQVTTETVVTLEELRRRGFAVNAVLNIYENYDYAQAAGALLAVGIDSQQLRDEPSIPGICRRVVLRM